MVSKVIVVGTGKIACTSLEFVLEYLNADQIEVFEYHSSSLSVLHSVSKKKQVRYHELRGRDDAVAAMKGIQEDTLVISANNMFLFPKEIVENANLDIVNYHSALLPQYPGVNAPTWAIYNGEQTAGITWHCIDAEVDHGDIIVQKKCVIDEDMTALALNRKQDELATQALKEILPALLNHSYDTRKQVCSERRIYTSKEVPDDGILETQKETAVLYRVLRSVDYGAFHMFPKMKVKSMEQWYQVEKYTFDKGSSADKKEIEHNGNIMRIKDCTGQLKLIVSPL